MAFLDDAGLVKLWQNIQTRLFNKVDKVAGKGLSSNDFTNEDKEKLASLKECVQPDWNVNDENDLAYVKNRTHWTESFEYQYAGDYDNYQKVENDYSDEFWIKISDEPLLLSDLLNSTVKFKEQGEEHEIVLTEEYLIIKGDAAIIGGEIVFSIIDFEKLSDTSLPFKENGLYFVHDPTLEAYVTNLKLKKAGKVHTLDEKYIPETIARKTDVNTPRDFIIFKDRSTGSLYYGGMDNGNWVTWCDVDHIEAVPVTPSKIYIEGMKVSPEDLIVTAVFVDGTSKVIDTYQFDNSKLTLETTSVDVIYKDNNGIEHVVSIPITVTEMSPEDKTMLVDFEYEVNGDGTYTLTDWKGTYNGEESTEIILPDSNNIIL